jgi:hypothetical protein
LAILVPEEVLGMAEDNEGKSPPWEAQLAGCAHVTPEFAEFLRLGYEPAQEGSGGWTWRPPIPALDLPQQQPLPIEPRLNLDSDDPMAPTYTLEEAIAFGIGYVDGETSSFKRYSPEVDATAAFVPDPYPNTEGQSFAPVVCVVLLRGIFTSHMPRGMRPANTIVIILDGKTGRVRLTASRIE